MDILSVCSDLTSITFCLFSDLQVKESDRVHLGHSVVRGGDRPGIFIELTTSQCYLNLIHLCASTLRYLYLVSTQ